MMIATMAAALAVTAPSAPLQPSGKWVVEYADSMCILSHDYGEGDSRVTIGFRPWPMGDQTEIVLVNRGSWFDGVVPGKAQVTLGTNGAPINGTYTRFFAAKTHAHVTTISVEQADLAKLGDATTVSLALDGGTPITVAPPTLKHALAALAECDKDLLRSWHVDPAEEDQIGTPAKAFNPKQWISADDYPTLARRRTVQGTGTILWTIGTDGRASNCNVVATTGDPAFDQAACAAVVKNARYEPALDKAGRPMISHASRRIAWRMDFS